jgi:hypothetical protein
MNEFSALFTDFFIQILTILFQALVAAIFPTAGV